jgi:exonuclease SbcD
MKDIPEPAWPYLEVRVQLDAPEPTLRSRIEAALDGKPVRLAKIEISSARANVESAAPISLDELEQMQPD